MRAPLIVVCCFLLLCTFALAAVKKKSAGASTITPTVASKSKEECEKLGFNSDTLKCNTCESVLRVVGEELHKECTECCTAAAEDDRFAFAVLEVDKRFLSAFPETAVILRSIDKKTGKADKEKKEKKEKKGKAEERTVAVLMDVTYRFAFGIRPTLHVYRRKGDTQPADSLSVGAWTVDVFTDFFETHKETVPAPGTPAGEPKKDEL